MASIVGTEKFPRDMASIVGAEKLPRDMASIVGAEKLTISKLISYVIHFLRNRIFFRYQLRLRNRIACQNPSRFILN